MSKYFVDYESTINLDTNIFNNYSECSPPTVSVNDDPVTDYTNLEDISYTDVPVVVQNTTITKPSIVKTQNKKHPIFHHKYTLSDFGPLSDHGIYPQDTFSPFVFSNKYK